MPKNSAARSEKGAVIEFKEFREIRDSAFK